MVLLIVVKLVEREVELLLVYGLLEVKGPTVVELTGTEVTGRDEVFVQPPLQELDCMLAWEVCKENCSSHVMVAVDVDVLVIVMIEEPD
jgi:hypothetical protein